MADPLSAAASVAGLVSLGLQVSSGIIKYIDAVKSRDEELTHIRKKNDILLSVIEAIQRSCSSSRTQYPQSTAAVTQTFQLCDTQLKALDSLLAGLTNGSLNPSTHTKVRDLGRKVKYPFRREQVKALTSTLDQAIATLQLAVQGLELDVSQQNNDKLNTLQTDLLTTSAAVRSGHNDIQNIIKELGLQTESQTLRLSATFTQSAGSLRQDAVAIQGSLETSIRPIVTGVHQLDVNQCLHQSTLDAIQRANQSYQTNLNQRLNRIEKLLLESAFGGAETPENQSVGNFQNSKSHKQIMRRIVAKPQSLRDVCDAFELEANNEAHDTHRTLALSAGYATTDSARSIDDLSNRYKCNCNARIRHQQQGTWLGPFGFFHRTESMAHLPDCPVAEFPAIGAPNEVGVRLLGLRNLLGGAITLSFKLSSGAGGFSISPGFTYYPTVDERNEPAFRILSLMRTVSLDFDSLGVLEHVGQYKDFMNRAKVKLKELFRNGKSSFLVVNSQNRNLIHALLAVLTFDDRNMSEHCDDYLCDLLEFFKYHQVPLMEYDINGRMTAFGCGPLTQATLADNLSEVQRILENNARALEERDLYGRSPLHFAGARPKILRYLLKVANIDQLNAILSEGALDAIVRIAITFKVKKFWTSFCYEIEGYMYPAPWKQEKATPVHTQMNFGALSPRDANYSYRIGFIDTDPQPPQDLPIWRHALRLDYLLWLIDHGVDMSRRLKRQSNEICNAHCILANVGQYLHRWETGYPNGSERSDIEKLLRRCNEANIADSCRCPCSPGGCTPQTSMLKSFANYPSSKDYLLLEFQPYIEMFDRPWSLEDHMRAIRFFTFDALELTHSCCDQNWDLSDIDEAEEEEDSFMLGLFDELVLEFEDHFRSIPEGHSYLGFWMSIWKVRIEEVWKILDARALTKEEIEGAINLGVVWDHSPRRKVQRGPDIWFSKLDEID
ncbi:hypothetical protein PFICI_00952 [Pestalotiopsis fici W106-1]|uniref:Azaphilone pigments biosynthesis cluster protein L N-terminal domain-containing protein n=1 Tax=Pestalotiopsis fici (strain W106-1 / CGMCC3.15140) TaxID=1229662 RepID=W3XMA4_PESFW|nr:uncharacterized protein PFICI_00952 [Pestalotiopsis fici W106-1]ETS87124.1 hypothetical protein PFICI_00952 [Pestalotiopsis fici W106-1]